MLLDLRRRFHVSGMMPAEISMGTFPDNAPGAIPHNMVTTALELPGYHILRNLGLVRGIVVRSRSVIGTIGAGLQTIVGGNISLFTKLCEQTRSDSFELMLQHAAELGANAIVAAHYDATELMNGVTEVLAYGTAAVVERRTT
jgi:uncharacterized protein YbjQ (UPF0145 family)